MLYYDKIDISKEVDLAKSNNSNKCMIATIGFSIMDSNFKILHAMVVIIPQI